MSKANSTSNTHASPVGRRGLVINAAATLAGITLAAPLATAASTTPVIEDLHEQTMLAVYRRLDPHQKEAALGIMQNYAEPSRQHPDAGLLAAIARFDELDRLIYHPAQWPETKEAENERDIRNAPLHVESDALLVQICTMRTRTMEGFQARARSILAFCAEMPEEIETITALPFAGHDDKLVLALIRDLVGEG